MDTLPDMQGKDAVRVAILRADGSAPRGAGAWMMVGAADFSGSIGGGALEYAALATARAMLHDAAGAGEGTAPVWQRQTRDMPLGPSLGQCCGGRVQLLFERLTETERHYLARSGAQLPGTGPAPEAGAGGLVLRPLQSGMPPVLARHRGEDADHWPLAVRRAVRDMLSGVRAKAPLLLDGWFIEPQGMPRDTLFLYGAGHVGREVVRVLAGLPFDVWWVDVAAGRFPDTLPTYVERLVAADPALAVAHAPPGAWHVVMSFSHALDLAICRAVLARGDSRYLGLIASRSKRARFIRRLRESGLSAASVAHLHAPIGLPGIQGKEPAVIAVSLAADLLARRSAAAVANMTADVTAPDATPAALHRMSS